jgi:hypothetical protein
MKAQGTWDESVVDKRRTTLTLHYDEEEAAGTVTVSSDGGWGPSIKVEHDGKRWDFVLDLFHLSREAAVVENKPCVQIIAYDPKKPDGEPIQHFRVYDDGTWETFDA